MARVAKGVSPSQVQKAVPAIKKMGDAKDSAKLDKLQDMFNVARPMAAQILWAAEPVIDPSLKFKANAANIRKARSRGLRVERIAAYAGISVSQLKNEYGDILDSTYVGRGARSTNGASASTKAKTKPKPETAKRGPGRPKGSTNKAKTKVRRRSALSQRP